MKLKCAALINIAGIIFASLSPALADTQSEKLREREKRLTEQAVLLSEKEINLEDKELQLKRKQAELDDFAKRLHSEKIEISVRDIENEDTRAKLNRDSEFLAAQNNEFTKEKEQFEGYRASVLKQAEDAERTMTEANEKLQLAQSREDKNIKRERELSEREEKIVDELSQINIEKAELLMLKEKTDESVKKLADLEKRENDLKTAQKIFDDEKKKIESERAELAKGREEAEKKLAEAKTVMAEAEMKMQKAEEILAVNQELEATIAQLRNDLRAKSREVDITPDFTNVSYTDTGKGIINWSDGSIRAKGMGIVPPDKKGAQGKALARRAAIADLQRNLLETVQGVQIDAKTQVKDFIATDVINTAVKGTIRGVEIVEESFDNEAYIVSGQIRQEKIAPALAEIIKRVKFSKKPAEPKRKTGKFTGLIIDATGLAELQQQKLMRIVDEKGVPVYGTEFADKNIQAQKGLCAYFDRIVFESNEQERVGNNPLTIKAQRLSNENAYIVIPNWAADEIRRNAIDFRKECRVIVVRS
ncbi:MAG: hypothetical protein IJG34_06160 [Synergistaceae bacterium]|nr:hypothetical protein [Synergistaceae bacterium]MBQ3449461.1 hypothetical protein [Synergistaceae bacterium]MBR0249639.1 hypothetical protein [Synergistaceae bacterium]